MSMTTKEMIAIMQASEDGKEIEYSARWGSLAGKWTKVDVPGWDWLSCTYRVKPEPKEFYVVGYTLTDGDEEYLTPRSLQSAKQTVQKYLEAGFKKARVIKLREVLDES